jgi:FkbM family methyltransferase
MHRAFLQLSTLASQEECSVLLHEMFQDVCAEDAHLRKHLAQFPFQHYSIYSVHGTDFYYLDEIPDLIKGYLRKGISWEAHIGCLIGHYARPGTLALDIGGHIGIHTLAMSRAVGESGSVYVFEPQVKLYTELLINMRLNEATNIQFYRKAVGAHHGQMEMEAYYPKNEGGMGVGKGGEVVDKIPLDALALDNVSLMKIDVEGCEEEVIEGARETIVGNRPVIIIEIMGTVCYETATEAEKREIHRRADKIEALGYRVMPIRGNNYLCMPLV